MPRRVLKGMRALVTGASAGIGRAVAKELAARGVAVLATARRAERLETLAGEIRAAGGTIETVAGDLVDGGFRTRLVAEVERRFGALDLLVNNAGAGALGRFAEDRDGVELRRLFELNFLGPCDLLRGLIPSLERGRTPVVVQMGSIQGYRAVPQMSAYAATKFALRGLTQAIRPELARRGIGMLLVNPARTRSEFQEEMLHGRTAPWGPQPEATAEEVARAIARAIETGRREITPHFLGWLMLCLNHVAPWVLDWRLGRYG